MKIFTSSAVRSLLFLGIVATLVSTAAAQSCSTGCAAGNYFANCTGGCITCPAGFYCTGNLTLPTPCPPGTFTALTNRTTVVQCTGAFAGFYAPGGTSGGILCPGLSTSTLAVASPSCTACSTGRAPVGIGFACVDCPAGTYANNATGKCTNCTSGFACPSRTMDMEITCPAGQYSNTGDGFCRTCAAGFACPATNTQCVTNQTNRNIYACPPGTYSTGNQTTCTACPPMFYCPSVTVNTALPCPVGFYASGSSSSCTICPAGFACPTNSTTGAPVACTTGTNAVNGSTACTVCPAGFACTGTTIRTACVLGRFAAAGAGTCSVCTSGQYCPDPAVAPIGCPVGTFSAGGVVSACTSCNGTNTNAQYQNRTNQSSCLTCPTGSYCPNVFSTPIPCPVGTYSPAGLRACLPCGTTNISTYANATGATVCMACPAGSFCVAPSQSPQRCPAGYFSGAGSYNCTVCPAGFQCSNPAVAPVACLAGTYTSPGMTACQLCPVNFQCLNTSNPQPCDTARGFYAPLGSKDCYPCPSGVQCFLNPTTQNISFVVCAAGTYRIVGSGLCKLCPPGFMCATPDVAPAPCPKGTYSMAGQVNCYLCPAGHSCHNRTAPVACPTGMYSYAAEYKCHPCEGGYQCPKPWLAPQPCPLGSYAEGSAINCTSCPPGNQCPRTDRFAGAASACPPGAFSIGGQSVCTPCPGGFHCPLTTAAAVYSCAPGYYSLDGQSTCTYCPPGFECPFVNANFGAPSLCSPGTFSIGGHQKCTECPPGFACASTTSDTMTVCGSGTFSYPRSTSCTICAAGFFCPTSAILAAQPLFGPSGVGAQIPCAAGTFAAAGATTCTRCATGFFCTSTMAADGGRTACPPAMVTAVGLQAVTSGATGCIPCPLGMSCFNGMINATCPGGTTSSGTDCTACPAGFSCPSPSGQPITCPAGTYSSGGTIGCLLCSAGFLCGIGSVSPTPNASVCPQGFFCTAGATVATPCPAGTYGIGTGGQSSTSACVDCLAGAYCPAGTAGAGKATWCPAGSYCPTGSPFPTPCPSGTYSNAANATSRGVCVLCLEGYFCPPGTANYVVNPCPPGYYCPAGTGSGFENGCPIGTYSTDYQLTSATKCIECPAGSYCPTVGLSGPMPCPPGQYQNLPSSALCQACEPGWSCSAVGQLSSFLTVCAPGHFCPAGTANAFAHPCPPGTYTFKTNLAAVEQCEVCWRGFACPSGTGNSPNANPVACATGHYCPGVAPQPNGKYIYYGGYSGPSAGSTTQYPCPPGTYASETDLYEAEQCTACPTGQYCPGGGSAPAGPCATGHYCPPSSWLVNQVPCAGGSYRPTTGGRNQGDCLACTVGNYCPSGSAAVIPCPMGSYTPYNRTTGAGPSADVNSGLCLLCPAGYFCALGSVSPSICFNGKYSGAGAGICTTCEVGRYCPQNATTADQKERLFLCPAGLFCPAGLHRVPSVNFDSCPAGSYCPLGTSEPRKCVPGTFNPIAGQASVADCVVCTAGSYCSSSGATAVTAACAPGFFCPSGSTAATQEPCPPRYYRSLSGAASEDFCAVCPSGYYCPAGTADPIPCTRGFYCVTGTELPQPCPIGTFGNSTMLKCQDDCSACTPGYYCDSLGLAHPTGLCDPGFYCIGSAFTSAPPGLPTGGLCPKGGYCPPGSSFPTACAEGTFNNFTGGSTQADCTACTPGYFCSGSNLPYPTALCAAGYYCTGGAATPTQFVTPAGYFTLAGAPAPIECPLGTFNPNAAQGSCIACVAGYYCPRTALVSYLLCPPGGYCVAASILPAPCPQGTFQPLTGQTNISNCRSCPTGKFCRDINLTAPSGFCDEGYYCKQFCITSTCGQYALRYAPVQNTILNPGIENNYGGFCPYGSYCGNGTGNPLKCPSGTFRDALQGIAVGDCTPCRAAYFCGATGMSFNLGGNAPQLCRAGYYCPGRLNVTSPYGCSDDTCSTHLGEACTNQWVDCAGPNSNLITPRERQCSIGFYCRAGSISPTPCYLLPNGLSTYQSAPGQYQCQLCPPGFWCDPTVLSSLQVPKDCPVGRYCTQGTTLQQPPCPAGSWSDRLNLQNRTQCKLCLPGRYCPYTGTSTSTQLSMPFCLGGYFCASGAMNGFGTRGVNGGLGGPCPPGHYCPNGTASNLSHPCPPGTYKPLPFGSSLGACLLCDAGMYCEGSGLSAVSGRCATGFYCPRGCSDSICSNKACTQGISSYERGWTGGPCPIGHYCSQLVLTGSIMPTPCWQGSYQDQIGQSTCKDCPAGWQCGVGSPVPARCGKGRYCPINTTATNVPRCPPGSFNDYVNAQSISQCVLCPPGRYCPFYQMNSSWSFCEAGYFCTSGAMNPSADVGPLGGVTGTCPTGHYCPPGTKYNTSYPCPPGSFNPETGARNSSSCLACTPGFYCSGWGNKAVTGLCGGGYYCPTACQDAQCSNKPCRGNCAHPTPYDLNNPYASGGICPSGFECPAGSTGPTMCLAGTYAPDSGMVACIACPAGAWCAVRTGVPQPCPTGHYCPINTTRAMEFPCPRGSYQPDVNASSIADCLRCDAGKYCAEVGMNVSGPGCFAGYFCVAGAMSPVADIGTLGGSGDVCPVGFYCPNGTQYAAQYPCPPGTYQPSQMMISSAACLPCTGGFYCPNYNQSAAIDICVSGHFCQKGCSDATCSNAATATDGGICPTGHICPGTLPRGQVTPQACPAGTYSPTPGRTSCLNCPPGYYCAPSTTTPLPCPLGRYCPTNTNQNMPRCPAGSYNDLKFGQNLTDCTLCDAGKYCARSGNSSFTGLCHPGFYCLAGAIDGRGNRGPLGGEGGVCPAGYWCGNGTVAPHANPCPAGSFQPVTGATNVSGCLPCLPGFYCAGTAMRNVTAPCDGGYFCPGGCVDATCSTQLPSTCSARGGPCPAGLYCPQTALNDPVDTVSGQTLTSGTVTPQRCLSGYYTSGPGLTNCLRCPGGYYCPQTNSTNYDPLPCPAGSYCPPGTGTVTPLCPTGSFSNDTMLNSSTQCQMCSAGRQCPTRGLKAPGGLCAAGYYCLGGAMDPFGRPGVLGGLPSPFPTDGNGRFVCPTGHYCPPGTSTPLNCGPGTYNPRMGGMNLSQSCIQCEGGSYCLTAGLSQPTGPCLGGYFCPRGCVDQRCYSSACVALGGGDCPVGHFCPNGTARPIVCPADTASATTGAEMCDPCPAGFYCPPGSAPTPCPIGNYCPPGTGADVPRCPEGTFSNVTGLQLSSDCHRCYAGWACTTPGITQPDQECIAGFFCREGAASNNGTVGPLGGDGGLCPAGFYCPPATANPFPCLAGTYNPFPGGNDTSACLTCLPGSYCSTNGLNRTSGPCAAGFYCPLPGGSLNPDLFLCPAGSYCPEGASYPTLCRAGSFSNTTGASSCSPCPPGVYCIAGEDKNGTGLCAPGYYCSGATNSSKPKFNGGLCLAGSYCPEGSGVPQYCDPGHYCATHGQENVTGVCASGYVCYSNATTATPTDNITGRLCRDGYFCPPGTGIEQHCPVGSFNPLSAQTNDSACITCPAGKYCGAIAGTTDSGNCSAGYFCPPGQSIPTPYACGLGFYCPPGAPMPFYCPSGTYTSEMAQSMCSECMPGYFCAAEELCQILQILQNPNATSSNMTNTSQPRICPVGSYCPNGTKSGTEFLCPVGTFNNRNGTIALSECQTCPPGKYCPTRGMSVPGPNCDAGFLCIGNANGSAPTDGTTGIVCPAGYYCESGTSAPEPCPLGTYNPVQGLQSLSQCLACDPGYYCGAMNLMAPSGLCAPGFYCPGGQSTPTPPTFLCPYGQVCPQGSRKYATCPSGTYASGVGQVQCLLCPAGEFCDQRRPCIACPMLPCAENYTCPLRCPVGHYCPAGSRFATQFPCPVGRYGPETGLMNLTGCPWCPSGNYCPFTGISDPSTLLCHAGYFCISGATHPKPTDDVTGYRCPAGQYCVTGAPYPQECPAGTYNPIVGGSNRSACFNCPPARACTRNRLLAYDASCTAGFYCPGGIANPGDPLYQCPIGSYCPPATAWPLVCPAGYWTPIRGMANCSACPQGYFCTNGTITICPPGHYCPNGTSAGTQFPCPIGRYNDNSGARAASNCSVCPPGKACDLPGLSAPLPECQGGFFCKRGATTKRPTDNVTGDICPIGAYCPTGSFVPTLCPVGTFNDAIGLENMTQCLPCTPGFYCSMPGLSQPTGLCEARFYCPAGTNTAAPGSTSCPRGMQCPAGSGAPRQCLAGFYVPESVIMQAVCWRCPAGYYCNYDEQQLVLLRSNATGGNATNTTGGGGSDNATECPQRAVNESFIVPMPCLPGYYCPEGTSSALQHQCPMGTFSNKTGLQEKSQCDTCPRTMFCGSVGLTAPTGKCAPGYYCLDGSSTSHPKDLSIPSVHGGLCPEGRYCHEGSGDDMGLPCPPGTWLGIRGARNVSWCHKCKPGFYCETAGLTTERGSGPCDAGYYCPGGDEVSALPALICPIGTYCPVGSARPTPCEPGTYNPTPGINTTCEMCPEFNYCPRGSSWFSPCFPRHVCPNGTAYPIICPNGTYAISSSIAMNKFSQCPRCPAGHYCSNGTITGKCAAGYLCEFGNGVPEPSRSTDVLDVKRGGLCPLGSYCPTGTLVKIPCSNQTVGYVEGLQTASDCSPCKAGFYCIDTSVTAITCPPGYYCPGYVGKSIGLVPCPVGTFNEKESATDLSWCKPCTAGYYCPVEALPSPLSFPTPQGFYSSAGQSSPYPCPGGSYQPRGDGTARNSSACVTCPVGFYCGPTAVASVQRCPEGTFCPAGTQYPYHCPGGYFCPANSVEPQPCKAGFYCPPLSMYQHLCKNGTYCPSLTEVPLLCPNGYSSVNNTAIRTTINEACQACPAGTFTTNTLYCEPCTAGYVCYGGTTTPFPTSIERDGGEVCPKGYYCPTGNSAPLPCPPGRYNDKDGGKTLTACRLCGAGQFQARFAQTECVECGVSSFSAPGAASCSCVGEYRNFQEVDRSCRCIPGYVFYTNGQVVSEDDSPLSCQPKVYTRCLPNEYRAQDGTCVSSTNPTVCAACPGAKGVVDTQVGICKCDVIEAQEQICNEACIGSAPQVSIDASGSMVHFDPATGITTKSLPLAEDPSVRGNTKCKGSQASCDIKVVALTSAGSQGVFTPPATLLTPEPANGTARRSWFAQAAASTKSLSNPIVCINNGGSMMWDVSDPSRQHYPVYLKDSLLNTNPNFDFTEFRELSDNLRDPNFTIRLFVFNFDTGGIYAFADHGTASAITLIRVTAVNEKCPPGAFQPITQTSLVALGVSRDDTILLAPDWGLIGALLGGLCLLVGGTIFGLYHFRHLGWGLVGNPQPRYRQIGIKALSKGDFSLLASKGTTTKRSQLLATGEERIVTPPGSSRCMTMRLDASLNDFSSTEFCRIIGEMLGVDPFCVLILSVTESTVVRFVLIEQEDPQMIVESLENIIADPASDIHTALPILAYETEKEGAGAGVGGGGAGTVANVFADIEDEFWDYERQIDLEGFNVRTLYDKLEDQTIHIVSQLVNQRDDVLLLTDKILVETEALKDMFLRIKLDFDERGRKDRELLEIREKKLSMGQLDFDLPDDVKVTLQSFLETFFSTYLSTNTVIQREFVHETVVEVPEETVIVHTTKVTTIVRHDEEEEEVLAPVKDDGAGVEGFKDMLSLKTISTIASHLVGGAKVSKGTVQRQEALQRRQVDIPPELLDDPDCNERERMRRALKREELLTKRLSRARRGIDAIVMPTGLDERQPMPGVVAPDELARLATQRQEYVAVRRAERKDQDKFPAELADDTSLPLDARVTRQVRRETLLATRLDVAREVLRAIDGSELSQPIPGESPQEAAVRMQKRDKFVLQKLEKLRTSRAGLLVPVTLDDDSDDDEPKRQRRQTERGDAVSALLVKQPNVPQLPSADAPDISESAKRNRIAALTESIERRIVIAADAIAQITTDNGLSDHSDLDANERERRAQARGESASKAIIRRGAAGAKAKPAQLGGAAQVDSMPLTKTDFVIADPEKIPAEYQDDSDLENDERAARKDLRQSFKQGRQGALGDALPTDESEAGISAAEKHDRQAKNIAYLRGRAAAHAKKVALGVIEVANEVKKAADALSGDAEAKKFLEMGKQQELALMMPAEYLGADERKQHLQSAFTAGRRAQTVSAVPQELDEAFATSDSDRAERRDATRLFLEGQANVAFAAVPVELSLTASGLSNKERQRRGKLQWAFMSGINAELGRATEEAIPLMKFDQKTRVEMQGVVELAKLRATQNLSDVPVELRDDIPLLTDDEIAQRRMKQIVYVQAFKARRAEVELEELLTNTAVPDAVKREMKEYFEAGFKKQRRADDIPEEFDDRREHTAVDRERVNAKRVAYLKGRVGALLGQKQIDDVLSQAAEDGERVALEAAVERGKEVQQKASVVPSEIADDATLEQAERQRREALRGAFLLGRRARAATVIPPEMPVPEGEVVEEVTPMQTVSQTSVTDANGVTRVTVVRRGSVKIGGSAAADVAATEEISAEKEKALNRIKKAANATYKALKEKQRAEASVALEELEEESIQSAKLLDDRLNDDFVRERKKMQELQADALLKAPKEQSDALRAQHQVELQQLAQSQEKERKNAQDALTRSIHEKKGKMKTIMDAKALNEMRLAKTIHNDQEAEVKRIKDDYQLSLKTADIVREEDLKKQKDALLERLKMRERRQKAKCNKEKELLEAQLVQIETLEKDTVNARYADRKDRLLRRGRELLRNAPAAELAEEEQRISKQVQSELEAELVELSSHQSAERLEKQKELADRQAAEKDAELKAAQEEVDLLIEAKRRVLSAANNAENSAAKDDDVQITEGVKNAVTLLVQQQKLREELERQRIEDAKSLPKDDVEAVKQEAAKEIARRERERGEKLTDAQKKEILEECKRNAASMASTMSDEQRKQQEEIKKRLEEKRRKREAELHRKQLADMMQELQRQEIEEQKKQAELAKKIVVQAQKALPAEVIAEEEEMNLRMNRIKDEQRRKHADELRTVERQLEEELKKQQDKELNRIKAEAQRKKLELQSEQTAREAMQMSDEAKNALLQEHAVASRKLQEQLDAEAAVQKAKVQDALEARKRRKKAEVTEKQRLEAMNEDLRLQEEKDTFLRQAKITTEKQAIDEMVAKSMKRPGSSVNAEEVAQVVMAQRHREEVQQLGERQKQRRVEEQGAREKKLATEKGDLSARLELRVKTEIDNIPADHPDPQARLAELNTRAQAMLAEKTAELQKRYDEDTGAFMDQLEIGFAEEQLQLKVRQWNEIAVACGMAAPEQALLKYQQKVAQRQSDDAEDELVKFRKDREEEAAKLHEKLRAEKLEYDKKMSAEMEKLRRDQEEEYKRKEAAMMEELRADKERREQKLKDARLAGARSDSRGPSAQESAEIKKRLLEDYKEGEQRIKEQLERERERQQSEMDTILRAKREKKKAAMERAMKAQEEGAAVTVTTAAAPATSSRIQETIRQVSTTTSVMESTHSASSSDAQHVASFAVAPSTAFNQQQHTMSMGSMHTGDAYQQWVSTVVQQLNNSPIMEKLVKIEKMLAGQVKHGLMSYYLDSKDRQLRANEGRLDVMELSELPTAQYVVYCFAASIRENIGRNGIQLPPVKVAIARSLPDAPSNASAFRNSYFYDHGRRTLFIRQSRLSNIGEFLLVSLHGLAHVKAALAEDRQTTASWNDGDPSFLTEFYGLLEVVSEELFYMRLPPELAHRETKENRGYRSDIVMSTESLAAMEQQLANIGKQNREAFLKTYLMM